MTYFFPLESLLRMLKRQPDLVPMALGGLVVLALVILALGFYFRKYLLFVAKSLSRNLVRTMLSSLAIMVLVFVAILIWSVVLFLDLVTSEKAKDLKAVITERYQIPSQMPFAYAQGLEEGAVRPDHPEDIKPEDSMTWQFFGGSMDPAKRTFENMLFLFAMDPRRVRTMMDDLDVVDPALIDKMVQNKKGILVGRERLHQINKQVGDTLTLTSFNYKDLVLEFQIVGLLPEGRYNQSAIMNRDYLNDALDAYPRQHNGAKHPMAEKTLNLVWLRVPDSRAFQKVANQVMTSALYTTPSVKCETASSGIAAFLDAYQGMLWWAKWFLVPGILVVISLVIANAISISVRERRTEMAVLKVLGFSPNHILGLVLGEALLLGCAAGLASSGFAYVFFNIVMGGIHVPIAFFPAFKVPIDALWWGLGLGGGTALVGSFFPAWSARSVKVSEVFAKIT